jgi:hypothetical protein
LEPLNRYDGKYRTKSFILGNNLAINFRISVSTAFSQAANTPDGGIMLLELAKPALPHQDGVFIF